MSMCTGNDMLALDAAHEMQLWCLLGLLEPQCTCKHFECVWEVLHGTSGHVICSLGDIRYHFVCDEHAKSWTNLASVCTSIWVLWVKIKRHVNAGRYVHLLCLV